MSAQTDQLEDREGLPDALRILLLQYPREAWEADPGFSQLIRFWLDRHLMFRRLADRLRRDTEELLDGGQAPEDFAQTSARLGSLFLQNLHAHHQIEDTEYFPILKRFDARLEHGFEMLDRDHHAIDGLLSRFAEDATAMLSSIEKGVDPNRDAGAFHRSLVSMERFLDRHLVDEEDLIVPILLRHAPEGLL